jgi:YD repeat-containing protein
MRQLFIILTIGAVLAGCQNQKEQLEKFVFDNSQISHKTLHNYMFDNSWRIKYDRRISYQYMAGVPLDSTVTETIFQYNDKGLLVSAIDLPDSSRQVKIYNDLDSLIGDYRINHFGDTTNVAVTVYDGNNVVRRINRHLSMRLPESFENIKKEDLRNYDTMLFITDLIYDKDLHVKTLFKDKVGMVSEETEQYYEKDKRTKTITYSFLGDAKYIKETTFYETTKDHEPDFVSVGTQGDTIAIQKTIKKSDGRIVLNYNKEFGMQDIWYYDNVGQLIAIAMVDVNAQEKTISKYTYDTRGNKVEEITYRERLNNAR